MLDAVDDPSATRNATPATASGISVQKPSHGPAAATAMAQGTAKALRRGTSRRRSMSSMRSRSPPSGSSQDRPLSTRSVSTQTARPFTASSSRAERRHDARHVALLQDPVHLRRQPGHRAGDRPARRARRRERRPDRQDRRAASEAPGTVYTAAEEIEAAGGQALPIVGDIRDEAQVDAAVEQTVERFGGIDICVNNASAINLSGTRTYRSGAST